MSCYLIWLNIWLPLRNKFMVLRLKEKDPHYIILYKGFHIDLHPFILAVLSCPSPAPVLSVSSWWPHGCKSHTVNCLSPLLQDKSALSLVHVFPIRLKIELHSPHPFELHPPAPNTSPLPPSIGRKMRLLTWINWVSCLGRHTSRSDSFLNSSTTEEIKQVASY